MSDVPTYGTPEKPFPELPPAASLYSVGWSGDMAVELTVAPTNDAYFVKYDPKMDSAVGSLCCWIKAKSNEQSAAGVFFDNIWKDVPGEASGAGVAIVFQPTEDSANHIFRQNQVLSGPLGEVWWPILLRAPIDRDKWFSLQMSWDAPNHLFTIALDGAVQDFFFNSNDDVPTLHTDRQVVVIQWYLDTVAYYDVWLAREYIDFNNPVNRARFISPEKKPVPLGPDGKLGSPTERPPEFFFHSAAGDDPTKFFTGNRGTEGPVAPEGVVDPTYKKVAKPTRAGEP